MGAWDTPAVKEARRDMRTKLNLPLKTRTPVITKPNENPDKIMRKLGTTRGPLNLGIFVTS